jgi:hypothetical protein
LSDVRLVDRDRVTVTARAVDDGGVEHGDGRERRV